MPRWGSMCACVLVMCLLLEGPALAHPVDSQATMWAKPGWTVTTDGIKHYTTGERPPAHLQAPGALMGWLAGWLAGYPPPHPPCMHADHHPPAPRQHTTLALTLPSPLPAGLAQRGKERNPRSTVGLGHKVDKKVRKGY